MPCGAPSSTKPARSRRSCGRWGGGRGRGGAGRGSAPRPPALPPGTPPPPPPLIGAPGGSAGLRSAWGRRGRRRGRGTALWAPLPGCAAPRRDARNRERLFSLRPRTRRPRGEDARAAGARNPPHPALPSPGPSRRGGSGTRDWKPPPPPVCSCRGLRKAHTVSPHKAVFTSLLPLWPLDAIPRPLRYRPGLVTARRSAWALGAGPQGSASIRTGTSAPRHPRGSARPNAGQTQESCAHLRRGIPRLQLPELRRLRSRFPTRAPTPARAARFWVADTHSSHKSQKLLGQTRPNRASKSLSAYAELSRSFS